MPRAAALALILLLAAVPAHATTCFAGQLPAAAWAEAAAQAAVRLVAMLPDGRGFATASGMVVAGSGAPNRILTAAHVVRTLQEHAGAWLAVFSSGGRYLGEARLAARAAPGPAFGLATGGGNGDAAGLRFGDAAAIAMTRFAQGGAAAYAAIAGLPLAPTQPGGLLEGVFTSPAGVEHGISGAGVVANGWIVGVMAFKATDDAMATVRVSAGDATATPPPRGPARLRAIRLPRQATGYAQPATDPALLAGLGSAGRSVGAQRTTGSLAVFVPGYVQDGCVGFRGRMHPA
jgi:hypothetical protein